jgi:polyisoprenyl-phosphate glycosyltransferase
MKAPSLQVSLVVPVYNESPGIVEAIRTMKSELDAGVGDYEIVVVDDGSTDTTWELLESQATADDRIKLVGFTRNFGKEAAILAGLRYSTGAAVVVIDGDLQHPPGVLGEMVRRWREEGAEVVHACKAARQQEPSHRRLLAAMFYGVMRVFSGYDLRDATDYKLLDRRVVDHYVRLPENARFFRGLIPWLAFRQSTVYFCPADRQRSGSRWTVAKLFRLGIRAICSFSALPMQIVTLLGALMFAGSFVLGFLTLYKKLSGHAVEGFSTVILLLLFVGSILMVSLGIIGQYVAMIYEEVKGRPAFIISRTRNIASSTNGEGHSQMRQ